MKEGDAKGKRHLKMIDEIKSSASDLIKGLKSLLYSKETTYIEYMMGSFLCILK